MIFATDWETLKDRPEAAATRLSEIAPRPLDHSADMRPRCETAE